MTAIDPSAQTVTIVGAGPGGLASALLLRQAGFGVQVFERDSGPGGRTKVIEKDGFRFDLGPTFLMYLPVFEEVFKAIGRDLFQEVDLVRLDPLYRLNFGQGGHLDCTSDIEEMVKRVADLAGEKNAEGFRKWWKDNEWKLSLSEPCLQTPWTSLKDLTSKRAIRVLQVLRPHLSVAKDLSKFFDDDRMVMATSFQSKYLGMSPYQCPSLFTILAFIEYSHGIFHTIGGLGSLTRRMAEIAEEMGVVFHYNSPVEEVLITDGKAHGVRVHGENHAADAIVINADFANAMTSLVDDAERKRWSNAKLEKSRYSCSTYMMYLGIEGRYDLPHHQIHISSDYEANLEDIESGKALTWDDPSFYVQNVSATDPTMAPDGHSTLYVLVPVGNTKGVIDWEKDGDRFQEHILDQMEKLGFTNLREKIRSKTILTPEDWEKNGIYNGAVFNLAHTIDQMLFSRPRNRYEDVDGMYLVGGGTHPGSGLPVIIESAKITSKLLCGDFKVKPDWGEVDPWFPGLRPPQHLR